jgi:hypothetical protein
MLARVIYASRPAAGFLLGMGCGLSLVRERVPEVVTPAAVLAVMGAALLAAAYAVAPPHVKPPA